MKLPSTKYGFYIHLTKLMDEMKCVNQAIDMHTCANSNNTRSDVIRNLELRKIHLQVSADQLVNMT